MLYHQLKYEREKLDISQLDLSKILNVSQQTVGSWETGRTEPNIDMLLKLANLFDVSVDFLLGKQTNTDKRNDIIRKRLDEILEKNHVVKPGEDLNDDQVEWLMKLVDKAIEMTKLN